MISNRNLFREYLNNPNRAGMPSRRELYREWFLKSEEWKTARLQALAMHDFRCFICAFQSVSNDVHHIIYPKNWFRIAPSRLFVLCRRCHQAIHFIMDKEHFERRSDKFKRFKELAKAMRNSFKKNGLTQCG